MHGNNRKSGKRGIRSTDMPQAFRGLRPARAFRVVAVSCLGLALIFSPGAVSAGDGSLQFLQALRENGYGDMAVEYLRILDKRPDLPKEVRDVWDLEMSRSLQAAAADAYDAREYERLTAQSRKHLEKFIGEHPDHPEIASAMISWGEYLGQRALERLGAARRAAGKDEESRTKLLAEAREELKQSQARFVQAKTYLEKRLSELPPAPKLRNRTAPADGNARLRAELEADLLEVRFQSALVDYYTAQTYSDPKDQQRVEILRRAAKGFDDIFQQDRVGGELSLTGLHAHLWHGKTAEEMGNLQLAADIYDEVLVNAAEPGERRAATGLEPLFSQVEYFRMLIIAKQNPDEFLAEAAEWLDQNNRRLRQTEGYQGIALEVAKTLFDKSRKASGPEKARAQADALRILTDMSKIHSPHQQDAMLLRRELLAASGKTELEIGSFEEAVAMADAAVAESQWERARNLYEKALALAEETKVADEPRVAAVAEALAGAEFMLARELFNEGKLRECIEAVSSIVYADQDRKVVRRQSNAASQAAALAVQAALNLYVNASQAEKPEALRRLTSLAEFTESNWPDNPEADDARMFRGQAKLFDDEVQEAIDIFERVNPKSIRYPQAMYYAGQNYARLYLVEKNKPEDQQDEALIDAYRGKAVERLAAGLEVLSKQVEPGSPLPEFFLDSQLLLAQIHADAGNHQEAAELYRPLIDIVKADKPKEFDRATIGIFLGGVRAYAALGEFDKAGETARLLIELGPDAQPINDVLVGFASLLDVERKKAVAAVTELESAAAKDAAEEAKRRLASINELLGDILLKLAERKEVSLWGMVFIADGLNTIGKTAEASRLYQSIIERAESDPEFAAAAQKAMTRVRAQLIGLLRKDGKFSEALEQVDQLIRENPRALEPLMEKGRILEAWAESEPGRYGDAVAHWVMLRNRLQPMRNKPDEYYEVMYNVAACLVRESELSDDHATKLDRAKKAEQVLKAALVLSPKLNGPDTVAQYKVLLNKAIAMQGRE